MRRAISAVAEPSVDRVDVQTAPCKVCRDLARLRMTKSTNLRSPSGDQTAFAGTNSAGRPSSTNPHRLVNQNPQPVASLEIGHGRPEYPATVIVVNQRSSHQYANMQRHVNSQASAQTDPISLRKCVALLHISHHYCPVKRRTKSTGYR
jgi:hypothetical protein